MTSWCNRFDPSTFRSCVKYEESAFLRLWNRVQLANDDVDDLKGYVNEERRNDPFCFAADLISM